MNLKQLRNLLDKKQISARELTQSYLRRIAALDGMLNSFITVCEALALAQADAAQERIDAGTPLPFTGIPLAAKDNLCSRGIPTTCASKMLADFIPPYQATVLSRLEAQGYVLLGKTNMDEFAMGGASQTSFFGGVKNPYDLTRVPGGSSGGSAAAVAAGLCPAALGSDTGGSVRQPAAFCGITGLKPTYGSVSRWGLVAFASSLDQIGTLAKSAYDAGYLFNAIAGFDSNDATSSRKPIEDVTSLCGHEIKGLKIGLPRQFFEADLDPAIKTAVLNAAAFYEKAGCEILDCSLPSLPYAVPAYYLLSSAEAASNLSRFDGIRFGHCSQNGTSYEEQVKHTRGEGFGMEVKRRVLLGNYALSSGYYDAYYKNAQRIQACLRQEYAAVFKKCDMLLTPTAPTTAYPIGTQENDPVKMYLADLYTVGANIAGLPALSTPCGYDETGLPIGMSLTGRPFDEKTILQAADCFEREFQRQEARLCAISQ